MPHDLAAVLLQRPYVLLILVVVLGTSGIWLKYTYGPFKIRQSQRKPALCSYRSCEVEDLPPHVQPYFLEMVPSLAAIGFVTLGSATRVNPEDNNESYASLWVNQKQLDTAQIITVAVPKANAGGLKIVNLLAFRTEFTDGTALVTSNSGSLGVFPKDPNVIGISVPAIKNIAELYRLHRTRVAHHRGTRKPSIEKFKDARSRLEFEHAKTYERLVDAGYYTHDPASDEYIPTTKGAFLMTYKLLAPFKQVQLKRKRKAAIDEMKLVGYTPANQPSGIP